MQTAEFQAAIQSARSTANPGTGKQIVEEYLETRRKTIRLVKRLHLSPSSLEETEVKCAGGFFKRWLGRRWPVLDTAFMGARRRVLLTRDGTNTISAEWDGRPSERPSAIDPAMQIEAQMPVFIEALKGEMKGQFSASIDLGGFVPRRSPRLAGAAVTAKTLCPKGINPTHLRKAKRFESDLFRGLAAVLRRGISLLDIVGGKYRRREIPEIDVGVIWAPLAENWTFASEAIQPAGDPAVIARMLGTTYLLDFFDTPDERPIGNLIREFTEGEKFLP